MMAENQEKKPLALLPEVTKTFITALFHADDIILCRFIETWTEGKKKRQRFISPQHYFTSSEILHPTQWDILTHIAEQKKANHFFGVCPRPAGRAHQNPPQLLRRA